MSEAVYDAQKDGLEATTSGLPLSGQAPAGKMPCGKARRGDRAV